MRDARRGVVLLNVIGRDRYRRIDDYLRYTGVAV